MTSTNPHDRLFSLSLCSLLVLSLSLFSSDTALAQDLGPDRAQFIDTALFFAAVALLPLLLILVTSFAKIVIVIGFLRAGLGLQNIFPTSVVTAIAVVLSAYIMAPVGVEMATAAQAIDEQMHDVALVQQHTESVSAPLFVWLEHNTGAPERATLASLTQQLHGAQPSAPQHHISMITAFALTELKEAFILGVLILIPFLVLEFVVANVLLSAGLQTISPPIVSLPFKLLLFVLIDGWTLLAQGLVLGYVHT